MNILWKLDCNCDVGYIPCLCNCNELFRITNKQKEGLCVR